MKSINELKDEVAKELHGIPDYDTLVHKFTTDRKLVPVNVSDEICKRYAIEVAKEKDKEIEELKLLKLTLSNSLTLTLEQLWSRYTKSDVIKVAKATMLKIKEKSLYVYVECIGTHEYILDENEIDNEDNIVL